MDLLLQNHVAAIVGGAHGLGSAIARAFLDEGARVVVLDRDPKTSEIAGSMAPDSNRATGLVVDVTDFAALKAAAEAIRGKFSRFDHLVFAAGIGSGGFGFPFWNVDPGSWDRVLRVNLIGAANAATAFAPAMAEAGSGTILFIASVAGQIGSQTDPPYSASKAGLINFSQCAAKDLAPHGVRVNSLCPGMVQTALNRSVYESWAARQPESSRPDLRGMGRREGPRHRPPSGAGRPPRTSPRWPSSSRPIAPGT